VSEDDVKGFFAEMKNNTKTEVTTGIIPDYRKEESAK
jgi:hypothetical protein